ncbi:MAG: VPLPA-CTERM sorting domain-containing protein [Gammaproteobacteria bacterium]|nr:VPLPA-CTERM sorting domain-containing protein [Gammaproteobacteria bacterium]
MKFWKITSIALVLSTSANAALIDNVTYTTDTATGLDWLDLNLTNTTSYNNALASLPDQGWRYATSADVMGLFSVAFDGYYDTNTYGYSSSTEGAYADQAVDSAAFQALFGLTEVGSFSSTSGLVNYTGSYGFFMDEGNVLRLMGTYQDNTGYIDVYRNYQAGYRAEHAYGWIGTYMVRDTTVVPVPAAVWLFGSGLIGLAGFARRKKV